MSVTITFYSTTSKKKELNKILTAYYPQSNAVGYLHTPTDIINPVVDFEQTTSLNPLANSYCKIVEFNRYYFIERCVAIHTNRWTLYLHEDVLVSHQLYILGHSAFVIRWENSTYKSLKDDLCNFEYNKQVIYGSITNRTGATGITTLTANMGVNDDNTLIAYMTDQVDHYSGGTNAFHSASQPTTYAIGGNISTAYLVGSGGIAFDMARTVYKNSAMKSFIKHITMYPFVIPNTPDANILEIWLGDNRMAIQQTFKYPNYTLLRILIADFYINASNNAQFYSDDFTCFEPFSTYEMYIPYVGWITVSSEDIIDKRIRVWYAVNFEEGTATAYVSSGSNIDNVIYTSPCCMGTKISLSYDNTLELETARNALYLNTATSLGNSAVAYASGNEVGAIGGLLKTGANFVNGWNSLIARGTTGVNTSASGMNQAQSVKMRVTRVVKKNYDSAFAKEVGLPYNRVQTLSSLTGFVQVGSIQMNEDNYVFDDEKKEIESILKSGYIYTPSS